jgi:hypothetical protein
VDKNRRRLPHGDKPEAVTLSSSSPIRSYLAFLEMDMRANPARIQPLSPESLQRAEALVGHLDVDPQEDLGADVLIE